MTARPVVRGKFLHLGDRKLYVRGVTYGTFRADAADHEYPPPITVGRDFALMRANGINAVRTYTLPPRWLLDTAAEHELFVLPSLAAERVVGYLNEGRRAQARIEASLREQARRCPPHPALLGYAVGNEIPASIVRWLGPDRLERFLEHLCDSVKCVDPAALVTYVNYPSTEYLELPFLDFTCFNVFLEQQDRLAAYLARLQNLAGDRPLLMTELGLDSLRNGEQEQARSIAWQLCTGFAAGCAGTFVYAWTDEWHRGGEDVYDWAFGVTDRDRVAKPALAAVRDAYAGVPFPREAHWPRVSVVVCAYNAEPTVRECIEAALRLDYPDYEVILVDDGSTDATAEVIRNLPVRLIRTENHGLSSARNTGLDAADGEIIAYLDSDAYPDPHWLQYLGSTFLAEDFVGVGGPNLPPPGDGAVADCVARSPGGPAHVLLSDRVAEHIPGCNMAFRASALREIGGFDPRFRAAGDDVDVCWRLQERGWTLGFSPAALVWHHRRNSLTAYWRQQCGYGRAEALLEAKWPEKYNAGGHFRWAGRIYDRGLTRSLVRTRRIYHGTWGSAPFQPLYEQTPGTLLSLPLTPEWLLLTATLLGLASVGALTAPPVIAVPLAVLATLAVLPVLVQASASAAQASLPAPPGTHGGPPGRRPLIAVLHVLQPLARLRGRLSGGLSPWRRHRLRGFRLPVPTAGWTWSERWFAAEDRLRAIENHLTSSGCLVRRGGDFDRWDLDLRDGPLGSARLLFAVEDLGGGAQLVRYRCWPVLRRVAAGLMTAFGILAVVAVASGTYLTAVIAGGVVASLMTLSFVECGSALGALWRAVPAGRALGGGAPGTTAKIRAAESDGNRLPSAGPGAMASRKSARRAKSANSSWPRPFRTRDRQGFPR
jgi:GT2 family glycosyltransferase